MLLIPAPNPGFLVPADPPSLERCVVSPLEQQLHLRTRDGLREEGLTRAAIESMLESGRLRKYGRFWYGTEHTPAHVRIALSSGGRPTCLSVLALYGVWVPPFRHVHVARRRGSGASGRPASPEGMQLVEHRWLRTWPNDDPVLPLVTALDHAARCLTPEFVAIVFESALQQRLVTSMEVDGILAVLPVRLQRNIGALDPRAQSGTETRVRRYLQRKGVEVVPQFCVPQVGATDMKVGELLIIECDSRAHHTGEDAYANDRRRDRILLSLGYYVVRLTWESIMLPARWEETKAFLDGLIRAGVHRAQRSRR